ncbi:MAG: 4Fe-4S binding protein [Evtepia gabavorous]
MADSDCTFCGQCVTHCPVGGLQERDDTGPGVRRPGDPNKKITVVQMAPAVRAALGE